MNTINGIFVNGENLDVGNAKTKMRVSNPLFDKTASYTFPFSLPLTARNKRILNTYIESYPETSEVSAFIQNRFISFSGKLVIQKVTSVINCTFYPESSTFYDEVRDKTLNDIEYVEDVIQTTFQSDDFMDLAKDTCINPDNYNYIFAPVHMPGTGFTASPSCYLNYFDPIEFKFYDPKGWSTYTNQFTPYFRLSFVLRKVFELNGYIVNYNAFELDELNTLYIANQNWFPWISQSGTPYSTLTFARDLPKININTLINYIENKFNTTCLINEFTKTVNIWKNNNIILPLPEYTYDITLITDKSIEIDLTVEKGLLLKTDFDDDKYHEDNFKEVSAEQYKGEVATYADLPDTNLEYGDIYYVQNLQKYYEYKQSGISSATWTIYSVAGQNMSIGIASIDKTNKAGTLHVYDRNTDEYHILPRWDKDRTVIGNTTAYKANDVDYMKLLFYRGLVPARMVNTFGDLPEGASEGDKYYVVADRKTYIWTYPAEEWQEVGYEIPHYIVQSEEEVEAILTGKPAYTRCWVIDTETQWEIDDTGTIYPRELLGAPFEFVHNAYPLLSSDVYYKLGDNIVKHPFANMSLYDKEGPYSIYVVLHKNWQYWYDNLAKFIIKKINWGSQHFSKLEWYNRYVIDDNTYLVKAIEFEMDFNGSPIQWGNTELVKL